MTVGLIGDGAIGRYVRAHLDAVSIALVKPARVAPGRVASVEDLPDGTRLMLECAGHAALAEHGPAILARGIDLVTVSLGALADDDLHTRLRDAAEAGGARLHLASGAIGALDCLAAARIGGLDSVTYTGRKPPAGWRGSPAEQTLDLDALTEATPHFEGSARKAALAYPKNANVAAAVALAGAGFDVTQVRLIADPQAPGNVHEIAAEGAFGSFAFRIEGRALPDNPRSAALAAMSVVATALRFDAPVSI